MKLSSVGLPPIAQRQAAEAHQIACLDAEQPLRHSNVLEGTDILLAHHGHKFLAATVRAAARLGVIAEAEKARLSASPVS